MFITIWLLVAIVLGGGLGLLTYYASVQKRNALFRRLILAGMAFGFLGYIFPGPMIVAIVSLHVTPIPIDAGLYYAAFLAGLLWFPLRRGLPRQHRMVR